jgi:phosphate-selective porin OprO/OprP
MSFSARMMARAGRGAGLSVLAAVLAGPALAQTPPADGQQARIDALEAQLHRLEEEVQALRRERAAPTEQAAAAQAPAAPVVAQASPPPPAATGTPTSAATADVAAGVPGTSGNKRLHASLHSREQIFGPGVPSSAAVSRLDAGHPVIATADGRFTASLIGVMQFDAADYFQRDAGSLTVDLRRAGAAGDTARARNLADGTTFRRARIGIAGKAFGDFEYTVLYDFGGSGVEDNGHVQELWLQYSGWKPAHFRVGAFAPFIGLEDAGSTNGMMFLERPTSVDIARSVAGGDFREAAQVAFTGKQWFLSGAITGRLVNTAGSSAVQPYQNPLGFIARGGVLPIRTKNDILHLAVHGSYVDHPANTGGPDRAAGSVESPVQFRERPELRVDGTRLIDTGAIDAIHSYSAGAEFAAQHKNFQLQAEYERLGIIRRNSLLPDPHFHGYYVEGSWMITGEQRRYNDGNYAFDGPQVRGSFDPSVGNWGAWELALRWSDTDLNYHQGDEGKALPVGGVRGGEQKILAAGVNWYLNSIARIMFQYQHVDLVHLSPNATTFQTPVGADIGQKYNTAAVRFQLAF